MYYKCFYCDREKKFRTDEIARRDGWEIIAYKIHDNSRCSQCPECIQKIGNRLFNNIPIEANKKKPLTEKEESGKINNEKILDGLIKLGKKGKQ